MIGDHERLYRLFDQLLTAFQAGDRASAVALWSQFETGLRNHFDFEELHLFPQLRKAHPAETAELKAEHGQLLWLLSELGVGIDLHLTRSDMVEAFVTRLRAHADREDALLYRWADTRVSFSDEPAPHVASGVRASGSLTGGVE